MLQLLFVNSAIVAIKTGFNKLITMFFDVSSKTYIYIYIIIYRDGQNHHMLMILKSKSNHLNKGDLKSKSF